MGKKNMYTGYLIVIISAVIYGTMPLMAKYIYADGVSSLTLVFLRNLLSAPVLAVLAWRQAGSLRIPAKVLPKVSIIALLGCCVTPMLLFTSYRFIPSSMATVFHFAYPALVVVGGILFYKKRAAKAELLAVAICVLGIACFYDPSEAMDLRGAALALFSAVTFAGYVLLLAAFRNPQVTGFRFTFYIALICSAVMLPVCLLTGQLALPTSLTGWLLSVLFAVGVNVGAVYLFQQGAFLIGGERTSILSAFEPITSLFVGALVLHEAIGLWEAVGSGLVIGACVLVGAADMRKAKKAVEE